MQKFKVFDTLANKYVVQGLIAQEVTAKTGIGNVKYLAQRNTLYKKRYRVEFDGEEITGNFMTPQSIYNHCKKFKVGTLVSIVHMKTDGDTKKKIVKKTDGKVIERYPRFLIVETENGTKESYSYIDIATQGDVEIKKGRPKKVQKR